MEFYQTALRDHSQMSPALMQKLNQAAMDIMAAAESARTGQQLSPAAPPAGQLRIDAPVASSSLDVQVPGPASSISLQTRLEPTPFSHMPIAYHLLRACVIRGISLLQSQDLRATNFLFQDPVLKLPLQSISQKDLLALSTVRVTADINVAFLDAPYVDSPTTILPSLLRAVEGDASSAVPRLSPPLLQTLRFGRTRTLVQTDLPGYEGEWLESVDVEEYLAQRGIFISNMMSTVPPAITVSAAGAPLHPPTAHNSEIPSIVNTSMNEAYTVSENSLFHQQHSRLILAPAYNMLSMPLENASDVQYGKIDFNPLPLFEDGDSISSYSEPPIASQTSTTNITIDLDKLVLGLANKATCLGPGPGIKRTAVDKAIRESVVNVVGSLS